MEQIIYVPQLMFIENGNIYYKSNSIDINIQINRAMYTVEKILNRRKSTDRKGKFEYLIKWDGWDISESTWEPEKHLQFVRDMIEDFERAQKPSQESYCDDSSFFHEKKPTQKKVSKRKPKVSEKEITIEDKFAEEVIKDLPEEQKVAKSTVREKQRKQYENNLMNESTLPTLSLAESKGEVKPRIKVLGMRKEPTNEFWYYVGYPDGTQSWVIREYVVENYPVSLIEFYEQKIVFSN